MASHNEQVALNGALFTMELFNKIANATITENVVFSPFSIQACLALAFAGAQGETADEISNVMTYISNRHTEVAEAFQYVLDKYKESKLFKIANTLYVHKNYKIKDSYQQTLKEYYHAEAQALNFADNLDAANAINSWVKAKTCCKIEDLISPDLLDENTRLVLLNAIHFKGNWKLKFDPENTADGAFWTGQDKCITIKFMYQEGEFGFGYFEDLNCTALEMPYENSDLSMLVLLPVGSGGLKILAEKLKDVNLISLASKMYIEHVEVKFPKFKIDLSIELNNVLKALGLRRVFQCADFSNMLDSQEDLVVSKIMHKAIIEVNEEGTEAAAATGAVAVALSMPTQFIADHPFLYIIWNKNNIFFAGAFAKAPEN